MQRLRPGGSYIPRAGRVLDMLPIDTGPKRAEDA